MCPQSRIQQAPLLIKGHVSGASGDGDTELTIHFGQTITEQDPLLLNPETGSDLQNVNTENEYLTESDLHLTGADTGRDSNAEDGKKTGQSPTIAGVVLVILSTAIFALAEQLFGLCKAAGVETSHLLLFRSVCSFTLNLGAMAFLAVVKSKWYELAEPQPSDVRKKSRLPMLMIVGMATTVTTVIVPMSYLFDIPSEAYQACIFALAPMYTTAMAYCFLCESFSHDKFWTMAVCYVGTFLFIISVPKPKKGPHTSMAIYLVALFLSPLVSAAFVWSRALLKNNVHPTTVVFAVQLTSILYLLPYNSRFVYEALTYGNVSNYSMDVWMAVIGHVICHSAASYLLYFGLKYEKAGVVQILLSGTIPFSLLLNFVMFGRVPFPSQAVGGALAAVGVAALVAMICLENK